MAEEIKKQQAEPKEEKKADAKAEPKKKPEVKKEEEKPKKTEAIAKGSNLPISTKHSIAICRFIRGKDIDKSLEQLEQVINKKRAIPMKGEIPHRKGMESGRYPIKATKVFVKLLKSLAANSSVNGLENV